MNDVDPLIQITRLIQDLGVWAVFLYLYVQERNAHNITRDKHMDDLREIANLRPRLQSPNNTDSG